MAWTCASESCLKAPLNASNAKLVVSYCLIMHFPSSLCHAKQIEKALEENLVKMC